MRSLTSLFFFIITFSAVSAFTVPHHAGIRPAVAIAMADKADEEDGMDLNLEEMFTMFDAADKEEEFDDAIKKVKSSDE